MQTEMMVAGMRIMVAVNEDHGCSKDELSESHNESSWSVGESEPRL